MSRDVRKNRRLEFRRSKGKFHLFHIKNYPKWSLIRTYQPKALLNIRKSRLRSRKLRVKSSQKVIKTYSASTFIGDILTGRTQNTKIK